MKAHIGRKITGVRLIIALFLAALSFGMVAPLIALTGQAAAANATGEWTDTTHILDTQSGQTFTQTGFNITNAIMHLSSPGACKNKPDTMDVGQLGGSYKTAQTALLYVENAPQCTSFTQVTFDLANTYNDIASGNNSALTGQVEWLTSTTMLDLENGNTYTESSLNNGVMVLTVNNNATSSCNAPSKITIGDASNTYLSATTATTLVANITGTGHGTCNDVTENLTVVGKQNVSLATTAHWQTADANNGAITIDSVSATDGNGGINGIATGDTWSETSATINGGVNGTDMTLYFPNQKNCAGGYDQMHVNPYQTSNTATVTVHSGSHCGTQTILIDLTTAFDGNANGSTTGTNTPATDGCILPDGNGLRWLMCPIFDLLQSTATAVNDTLINLLVFPVSQYFTPQMETMFNIFRNLAVAMLVIAGLAMVISQAADLEIFAAHTVRKALPRIIVAAILISLAWPLLKFVVQFFNDIGTWIGKIILGTTSVNGSNGNGGPTGFGSIIYGISAQLIAGLGALTAFSVLGIGGIFSLFLSLILLVIVGIFVLAIRQIIILICILLMPIAIAARVTPGTEKFGKFIEDTGLTALFMFPIIMAFVSAGAAMAQITVSVKSGDFWYHILAIIFYIAPYLMLPFAFRIAGGLMERLISLAQGTHNKTIESRLQGYRKGEMQYRHQQRMEGRRGFIMPRRLGGDRLSRAYRRFATREGVDGAQLLPFGQTGASARARYRNLDRKRMGQLAENIVGRDDAGFAANNDTANEIAVKRGMTQGRFVQEYVAATHAGDIATMVRGGMTRANAERAAVRTWGDEGTAALGMLEASYGAPIGTDIMRLSAYKAATRSGTSYRGSVAGGTGDLVTGQSRMYTDGGDLVADHLMSVDEAVNAVKFNQNAATRKERTGASYGAVRGTMERASTGAAITATDVAGLERAALYGAGPSEIIGARPETLTQFAPHMATRVATSVGDLTRAQAALAAAPTSAAAQQAVLNAQQTVDDNLAQVDSIYNYLKSTSQEKADIMAKQVMGRVVTESGAMLTPGTKVSGAAGINGANATTIRTYIEKARVRPPNAYGQQTFLDKSREYQSGIAQQQAAAAAAANGRP